MQFYLSLTFPYLFSLSKVNITGHSDFLSQYDRIMGQTSHSLLNGVGPTVKKYCKIGGASHT